MEYNDFGAEKNYRIIPPEISSLAKKVGIVFFVLVIIISLASGFFYYTNKELVDNIAKDAMVNFSHIINEEGEINPPLLILNNIRVCFLAIALGFIPFLRVPAILIPINAAIIGIIMVAIAGINPFLYGKMFLLGILPHGIFELPAIFLSVAAGIYICRVLSNKILKRTPEVNLGEEIIKVIKVFLFVCVPLMIIAGIIETTVTPYLITNFFI